MIKKLVALGILILFFVILIPLMRGFTVTSDPGTIAKRYLSKGVSDTGAANIVTSVVITYRGLDTLGEVAVLFITATGIGFLLRREANENDVKEKRDASELLQTGASFLLPFIMLFGVFIFVHGHLTPGGGFQGGVIIATGLLLMILSDISYTVNEALLGLTESLSGAAVVILGLLGIVLAAGFFDNTYLPMGTFGTLLSAGAIPLIYSLIGIKVGAELTGILNHMSGE